MIYRDRKDAGQQLAQKLIRYREQPDLLVLGLPRGGVTVAFEIAQQLHAPIDVLIVRKIGFPGNPELAAGAVSETGTVVLNKEIISHGVSKEYLSREIARQKEEIVRRVALYRGGKAISQLAGKTVVVVDDGVATGATVKAAVSTLKQEAIARLVVALPVASREAEDEIAPTVDEWVVLQTPPWFGAVGQFYDDFRQVEDEEVVAMLKNSLQR